MQYSIATWLAARKDFVEGRGGLKEIASRHNILEGAIRSRSKREAWSKARSRFIAKKIEDPLIELPPVPKIAPVDPKTIEGKIRRLEAQISRLDDMLDNESDPSRLDKIASARTRLFESWCRLSAIPLPGSMRRKMHEERRVIFDSAMPPDVVPIPTTEG